MVLPRSVAKANRFVLNPVVRLVAGWLPGFAIVRHRGRRSGTEYATPINIFRIPTGFMAALTYGPGTDWIKNMTAAGGGTIRHRGREINVGEPIFVATVEGMAAMPRVVQRILRATNTTAFVRWEEVDGSGEQSQAGPGSVAVIRSRTSPVADPPCQHLDRVRDVEPSAQGCEDCLRIGSRWVHLRICMTCGHVGCCDSSPNRHATAHWRAHEDHPLIRSFEPGEDWWWCYVEEQSFLVDGAAPAPSYERR